MTQAAVVAASSFPTSLQIDVPENAALRVVETRRREWHASLIATMAWVCSHYATESFVLRGQVDANWNVTSSLWRHSSAHSADDLLKAERRILASVSRDHWFEEEFGFTPDRSFATRALLQHYGIPTKLIDVTTDPLVALYFAVCGDSTPAEHDDKPGAIYLFRKPKTADQLPYSVQPAPQISPRVTSQRSMFLSVRSLPNAGTINATRKIDVDFASIDARGSSQVAQFSTYAAGFLNGAAQGRPASRPPNVLRFLVPADMKATCRAGLSNLGVNAAHLFPGSEGYKRSLRHL